MADPGWNEILSLSLHFTSLDSSSFLCVWRNGGSGETLAERNFQQRPNNLSEIVSMLKRFLGF